MPIDAKERLALTLKRVSDLSASATKVGIFGLLALAIIWFGEVRPAYEKLLRRQGYPEIERSFETQAHERSNIDRRRDAGGGVSNREEKSTIREEGFKRDQLIAKVSFEVLGLKVPVTPLYAPVVWNTLLIGALFYLALARRKVWTLLATAVGLVKQLKRDWDQDDVPDASPLWLAPVPRQDLRSASEWESLHTLPNLAATIGLALLVMVQLDVVRLSCQVLRRSAKSFETLAPFRSAEGFGDVSDLLVGPVAAATLSLLLLVTLVGTVVVVIWWCRRWDLSQPAPSRVTTYQLLARFVVVALATQAICLAIAWAWPNATFRAADWATAWLPAIIWGLGASIAIVAAVELVLVAYGGIGTGDRPILTGLWERMRIWRPVVADMSPTAENVDGQTTTNAPARSDNLPTRRHVIAVGIAVGAALLWPIFSPKRGQWPKWTRVNRKRARRRQQGVSWTETTDPALPEGFYAETRREPVSARSKRPPVRYVDASHRVLFSRLAERTLKRLTKVVAPVPAQRPLQLRGGIRNATIPRDVNPARASVIFEIAALERIAAGQFIEAADLLLLGIQHDLASKKALHRGPSIRLYDLLARLSVSQNLAQHHERLLFMAQAGRALVADQQVHAPAHRSATRGRRRGKSSARSAALRGGRTRDVAARDKRLAAFDRRVERWRSEEWRRTIRASEQRWRITLADPGRDARSCKPARAGCEEFVF